MNSVTRIPPQRPCPLFSGPGPGSPIGFTVLPRRYAADQRPLRRARRRRRREPGGDQENVSHTRAQAPSGPQPGRPQRRGEVQGDPEGILRSFGRGEARAIRRPAPVRRRRRLRRGRRGPRRVGPVRRRRARGSVRARRL